MGEQPSVSVVIPCYTSSAWLPELVERLTASLDPVTERFEIVLVNDASPDDTWKTIADLAARYPQVRGIDLMRNVGQFSALMCGLESSTGELVVTMDDDLQHAPEDIPMLIAALEDDPETDAVIGRYNNKKHSGSRNIGTAVMETIYRRAYGKPKDLKMTSLRALRRPVVEGMTTFGTVRPVPGALLLQTTDRIKNVPVAHHPRTEGKSGYKLGRLIASTFDNVINSSTAPLQAIALLGIALAAISALMVVFYLVMAIVNDRPAPGFTTLVLLIVFFGGTTLFAIGVVGEYVSRVVAETTRPPRYLIRDDTSKPS